MQVADRIVADAETCSGHPRVAGTRIRVAQVLEMLGEGVEVREILADYPELSVEDLRACLLYAAACMRAPAFTKA
jgi:uncharacterized protein (DUF433 family)